MLMSTHIPLTERQDTVPLCIGVPLMNGSQNIVLLYMQASLAKAVTK